MHHLPRLHKITCYLLAACLAATSSASAQLKSKADCERDLDEAKLAYSNGQLGDVGSFLSDECLFSKKLSKESKVSAYRLLTETSLFSNDLDNAENHFELLLRYNPLFEVDSTDQSASYDLIYLSRTYRRNPVISWYGSFGVNYSRLETLQTYGASNTISTQTNLDDISVGWNLSSGIEIPVYQNFDFVAEANFAMRNYRRTDNLFVVSDVNNAGDGTVFPFGTLQFKEVQTWIDIPVIARYNYHWRKKIIPYAYVGAAPNFLLSSKLVGLVRRNSTDGRGGGQVAGDEKNTVFLTKHIVTAANGSEDTYKSTYQSLRNTFNVSLIAGVGCKFRVQENFIFFDVRYNRFLLNTVNIDNRYTQKELLYRYGYVDNDYRIDNLAVSLGFMKSFYKPRKKRMYDPVLAALAFDKSLNGGKKNKNNNTLTQTTSDEAKREMRDAVESSSRDKKNYIDAVRAGRATVNDAPKQ